MNIKELEDRKRYIQQLQTEDFPNVSMSSQEWISVERKNYYRETWKKDLEKIQKKIDNLRMTE